MHLKPAQILLILAGLAVSLLLIQSLLNKDPTDRDIPAGDRYVLGKSNLPIIPIPQSIDLDQRKVELGRKLFNSTKLSKDDSISCNSCHNLQKAGTDDLTTAIGIKGQKGTVNSPTVLNSGFNFRQFWDGRAATLEEQVSGPIHNPIEMGSNWDEVITKLELDARLRGQFFSIWKDGITRLNIESAIAEFERSLITPNAPFDRFLMGDQKAITKEAKAGWELFRNLGCISCHQGMNIGGNMYANLGVMDDYFGNLERDPIPADLGRFNVTGDEEDRHQFKVPSLRNIAKTPPYFHDGSLATLSETVNTMAHYQLGLDLTKDQNTKIVAFLESLTGELEGKPL